jgi:hypothetical protein
MGFKGSIRVIEGKLSQTCTTEADLIANQAKYPAIRGILEYAEQRQLTTLLTSGMVGPYGMGYVPTKVGDAVTKGKDIGDNAFKYSVQGRIQRPSRINAQVGASQANGTFQLSMADNNLYPGMNVLFYGAGLQARVMAAPTGGAGNWIYTFQTPDGTVFDWATHCAGQSGDKTCFGGNSTYGEGSLRGYGNSYFPDTFIQHTTIQRKGASITGDAASDILWLEYTNEKNQKTLGWMFEKIRQGKAQFAMENEFQKIFGVSSMKNDDGSLRTTSRLTDYETGLPIIQGDGILNQMDGANDFSGTGTNGEATADDFTDAMSVLKRKAKKTSGNVWVCLTGTDGMHNAQVQAVNLAGNQNIVINQNIAQNGKAGGADVEIGFNFTKLNINGDSIWFICHPLFDDAERFPEVGSDGKLLQSSMYLMLDMGTMGDKNIEILAKGGNGFSRAEVSSYFNGLTGWTGSTPLSGEDAIKYEMLKQDMIVMYNTQSCGVIRKTA